MPRRAICAVVAALLPVLGGCFRTEPYASSQNVTMLKRVHVNSLAATSRGAWYFDSAVRSEGLTYGFITNGGRVTQRSFRLASDEPMIPYQGWGNHIQPIGPDAAFMAVVNVATYPHEDAIVRVSLAGRPPVLVASHDLPDFGGLALVNGRLFIGLASRALGELRGGRFAMHVLRNDRDAPWNTSIVVAGTRGRVYASDGQTNRFGIFDTARQTWRFLRFQDRGSFAPIAPGLGDEVWLYSLDERRLVLADLLTGKTVMELTFPQAESLAPVGDGGVCAASGEGPQTLCVTRSGNLRTYDLDPPKLGAFVAANGGPLWYAINDLKAPIWSFGDSDWGSAVGRIQLGRK